MATEPAGSVRRRRLEIAAVIVGAVAMFAVSLLYREGWVLDDALIFQNYIRSIAEGVGWGYGPGTTAEGYSSPLWVLLLVGAWLVGGEGFLVAKAVGAGLGLLNVALVAGFVTHRRGLMAGVFAGGLVACQPAFAWWSATGMETPLLMLLLSAMTVGVLTGRHLVVVIAGGLAAMTRPEGPIYLLAGIFWVLLEAKESEFSNRRLLGYLAIAAAPLACWHLFRFVQYGALLANSALAKLAPASIEPSVGTLGRGLLYLNEGLWRLPAAWSLFLVASVVVIRRGLRDDEVPRDWVYGGLLVGLTVVFVFIAGGDWMPWTRFFVPIAPSMLLLAVDALFSGDSGAQIGDLRLGLLLAVLLAVVTLQVRDFQKVYARHAPGGIEVRAQWPDGRRPFLDPLPADPGAEFYAQAILRFTKPGDAVVHLDIGQSGYLAGDVEIIDAFGLVSRPECLYQHGMTSPDALRERFREANPALAFILLDAETGNPYMRVYGPMWKQIQQEYKQVAQRSWWQGNKLTVWVRKDALDRTPSAERLERWRRQAPGLDFDRVMPSRDE